MTLFEKFGVGRFESLPIDPAAILGLAFGLWWLF